MTADDKSTPRTIEPGAVLLDRYVVEEQVAEGGMAAIHTAQDRRTGRQVALKVLYPFYSQNEVVRARFINEGRIQRYLDHPNIINVYDIVEEPVLTILMEYIDGPSLEDYLGDHGPLSLQELLNLMLPVLSAIGFAHHQGVIHRDIKPSNILLKPTSAGLVPKVMDFGVAKVERGKELTAAGTTVGTLHYMSPEQIVGSKDIDGRADIYSLGVTIYKLCTGDVPFNASTEFALMMAQVEADPTPPRDLRPELSTDLEEIILKTLSKKPEHRFQTVKELTSALLGLQDNKRDYAETDTETAPLPARLLEYAMMADEVAIDRTGELDIDMLKDTVETERREGRLSEPADDETIQLDADRLQAHVRRDKALKASPMDDRPTHPMDQAKVPGVGGADSREQTQPFDRVDSEDDQETQERPGAGSAEGTGLSQETTQRVIVEDDDLESDGADMSRTEMDSRELSVRGFGDGEARNPQRARASGPNSQTKLSRDEVQQEFLDRFGAEKSGGASTPVKIIIVSGALLVVALTIVVIWLFVSG